MNINQSIKFINRINRETKEGLIKWEEGRSTPQSLMGTESFIGKVYVCKILDKYLQIYKFQSKYFFDEGVFEWIENYRLEFIDMFGKPEWAFPENRATYDLYETVRYKSTDVEGFFEKYFEDEKDTSEDDEDAL
jgi:hypothetical protein